MRFSIFYEHQLPRPWDEASEQRLMEDALDQIELADRVGFDYVWEVEHHFMEEYSHSSAPEVFLGAASQRTKSIRLGHGIVNIMPAVNHPARVAERVATLDLVSGGRVDFGTGEASSAAELGGFGIRRERKRAMWEDAMSAICHMFVEEPFAGWASDDIRMPPRNVVPKPAQKPHPPLWVACSRRETIHFAAQSGIGALSFSFVEPEDAGKWVREYYEIIESDDCNPVGFAVNPKFCVVLPMMCHDDEQTAIERGIDGAHHFGYSLAHYYGITPHEPGRTSVWDEFIENRDKQGFARDLILADKAPLGVKIMEQGLGSLRGAIGTPEQISDLVRRYQAVGVDQIGFVLQAGRNKHEHICEALELFAKKVMPEFAKGRDEREAAKAERLGPAIEAALARRSPPREAPRRYRIDEPAEVERARRRTLPSADKLVAAIRSHARRDARRRGEKALARLVEDRSDTQVERLARAPLAKRVLFTAMAASFTPRMAFGFEGEIEYELTESSNGGAPDHWTIVIRDGKASARHGPANDAAVRLSMGTADLLRLAAGANPGAALLEGRTRVEGDFSVAMRLPEMFGAPSPY
jgi:alkanesulfonate monooxygenase SsuD/methylene tetrahydromethanopterin reductase-like flavin-dependent oxidoreductase (luciferase family)/putative sterol carrier protein